jgi:hypothetical protein
MLWSPGRALTSCRVTRLAIAVSLTVCGAVSNAQVVAAPRALSLDSVLARHAAAVGPVATITTRRTSLLITGMAPFDIPIVVDAMRPNLLRKTMTLQGSAQVTAFDGAAAWRIDPFASSGRTPIDVPAAELADLLEESDFDGPLLAPVAARSRLAYVGPSVAVVAGRQVAVHSVRVTFPGGRQSTLHLDATSFLEVARTQRRPVMGNETEMQITSRDYRQVNGVRVPHLMEIAVQGSPAPIRIVVRTIEFNVPMQREQFQRPPGGR